MNVSLMQHDGRAVVPVPLGWGAVTAGLLAVFATYWDEAWHTDVGRDTAWSAPHLMLYGAVAVVGLAVAGWGLCVLVQLRSLRRTLAEPPLLAASLGGLGALVAAPIDAAWHTSYGRDAVLFSPPHMLVVLASTALVLGMLAGMPPAARALRLATAVLLMANVMAVVFEFEADVPQYDEKLYLPLLLCVGLAAGWLVREVVTGRLPVTAVVMAYALLRIGISLALVALGRSTPDLPVAVLGLAALDLRLPRRVALAAATATVSALALAASAAGLASPHPQDVATVALPVIVVCVSAALLLVRRGAAVLAPLVVFLSAVAALVPAERASAHDPGQGVPVSRAQLTVRTDASRHVFLRIRVQDGCDELVPRSIVARRAGAVVSAGLTAVDGCTFEGAVRPPRSGRWFVYATYLRAGSDIEAWVPVEVGSPDHFRKTRSLYVPAGGGRGVDASQFVAGGVIYLAGLGLIAVGVFAIRTRHRERTQPGAHG